MSLGKIEVLLTGENDFANWRRGGALFQSMLYYSWSPKNVLTCISKVHKKFSLDIPDIPCVPHLGFIKENNFVQKLTAGAGTAQ